MAGGQRHVEGEKHSSLVRIWSRLGNASPWVILAASVLLVQALWLFNLELTDVLGLQAIGIAIAAVLIAIQHTRKLETVADQLEDVALSVPTRSIGLFPDYLLEVPGVVERATKSIKILCDTPAHGAFSNTAAFIDYWHALRMKMIAGKVAIECKYFEEAGRRKLHEAQIDADRRNWEAWKRRNEDNCQAFDQLAQAHRIAPPTESTEPAERWADTDMDYVTSMMKINEVVLAGFDGSVKLEGMNFNDPLPSIYFWSRDGDQEAVFVIVPVQEVGVTDLAGFHTKEPGLISALETVFDRPGRPLRPAGGT